MDEITPGIPAPPPLPRPQTILIGIVALTCLVWFLSVARIVVMPFLLSVFLSFMLIPLIHWQTRKRIPKLIAIFTSFIAAALFIVVIGLLAYSGTKDFRKRLPDYERKLVEAYNKAAKQMEVLPADFRKVDWESQLNLQSVSRLVLSSLGNFLSFLTHSFIVFVFLLFILLELDQLPDKVERAFGAEASRRLLVAAEKISGQIQTYLVYKTLISAATGTLVWGMLNWFNVDFAILWGLLAFLLNFIPNIGSTVAAVPPILVTFVQTESLATTSLVFLLFTVIQVTIGGILEPRIMGGGLNLSPIVVFGSLIFWGWIWGVPGALICVPLAAAVKIVCDNVDSLRWIGTMITAKE